ncbi:MAG: hypothetical protein ABH858_01535, partial [Candidatus Omnitrophota bacterium]
AIDYARSTTASSCAAIKLLNRIRNRKQKQTHVRSRNGHGLLDLFTQERLDYLSLIGRALKGGVKNKRQDVIKLLYFGAASDVSTCLLLIKALKERLQAKKIVFIFADKVRYLCDPALRARLTPNSEAVYREEYFSGKRNLGYVNREFIDSFDGAEYPLKWELDVFETVKRDVYYYNGFGFYKIFFALPNDDTEYEICYYKIDGPYGHETYTHKFVEQVTKDISLWLIKGFNPYFLPSWLIDKIIDNLPAESLLVADQNSLSLDWREKHEVCFSSIKPDAIVKFEAEKKIEFDKGRAEILKASSATNYQGVDAAYIMGCKNEIIGLIGKGDIKGADTRARALFKTFPGAIEDAAHKRDVAVVFNIVARALIDTKTPENIYKAEWYVEQEHALVGPGNVSQLLYNVRRCREFAVALAGFDIPRAERLINTACERLEQCCAF